MVFCNLILLTLQIKLLRSHNPYFNRWFSAIILQKNINTFETTVTILILIDGFLQYKILQCACNTITGHNPYFNRWFSAIRRIQHIKKLDRRVTILILIDGFLQ